MGEIPLLGVIAQEQQKKCTAFSKHGSYKKEDTLTPLLTRLNKNTKKSEIMNIQPKIDVS